MQEEHHAFLQIVQKFIGQQQQPRKLVLMNVDLASTRPKMSLRKKHLKKELENCFSIHVLGKKERAV